MQRKVIIFRALANINRLKIIDMFSGDKKMSVGDIAHALKISFTATSNHLIILKNLDVLDCAGTEGHVYYFLNKSIPSDFKKVINSIN